MSEVSPRILCLTVHKCEECQLWHTIEGTRNRQCDHPKGDFIIRVFNRDFPMNCPLLSKQDFFASFLDY